MSIVKGSSAREPDFIKIGKNTFGKIAYQFNSNRMLQRSAVYGDLQLKFEQNNLPKLGFRAFCEWLNRWA
jgi:hypothetical protein